MWWTRDPMEKELKALAKQYGAKLHLHDVPPDVKHRGYNEETLLQLTTQEVPEGCGQFSFGASHKLGIWMMWTPDCSREELILTMLHELGHYVRQWTVYDVDIMTDAYIYDPIPYEHEAWDWTEPLLPEYGIDQDYYQRVRDFSIWTYKRDYGRG